MKKIIKYVLLDLLRNKIILAYTVFLLIVSLSVFNLEDNPAKGLLSLLNIILIIVPLVSIIFSTIYVYNSAEFIELLVSQPIKRRSLWVSIFSGLSLSLVLAFFVGAGMPILLYSASETGIIMMLMGMLLSIIFVAIALLSSVKTRDKAKGIGIAILLWFFFSLIYDGIILFLLFQFSDYPLEKATIIFSSLNPIDLGRILILLKMDISALMGYTGAVFKQFFEGWTGIAYTSFVLMLWIIVPAWLSLRKFNRKDL
ncbi:MAG TPA: ABC transporter permease subunit [Chitinophagaceae bacterium]|nr:ABC transporter permease subunit [Chitinophagaceae bacterium]